MAETLALWRRGRFEWGRTDCIMSACAHVLRVTGVDPGAPWRGTYHDRAGAEAICGPYGGVLAIMRHMMAASGFSEATPEAGFPVISRFGGEEIAGLCTGRRVAFMMEGRGCIEIPAEVVTAWRI